MTALLIATGVGVFVGMLLVLGGKAEGRQHGFSVSSERQPLRPDHALA